MGVVYKARDLRLDRFVCIKALRPEQLKDESRKQRFIQEAKSASSLNHPNIITIHEIDQADGTDFMVMEFVAGKTLQQLIPSGGLPVADVLKYAIPIASALAAANAAGIIHRDIKPGNIMVGANGIVKVLDFGLAKLTAPEENTDGATQTIKAQTEEGTVVGTAAYMSPEQAQGKTVDARSDIFSFGAVLYEMLTGRRAFPGAQPHVHAGIDSPTGTEAARGTRFPHSPGTRAHCGALPAQRSGSTLPAHGGFEGCAGRVEGRVGFWEADARAANRENAQLELACIGLERRPGSSGWGRRLVLVAFKAGENCNTRAHATDLERRLV